MSRLAFHAIVSDVYPKTLLKHIKGTGTEAAFKKEPDGWYIQINGAFSLFVGYEKPDFEKGDTVKLTLEKESL